MHANMYLRKVVQDRSSSTTWNAQKDFRKQIRYITFYTSKPESKFISNIKPLYSEQKELHVSGPGTNINKDEFI